MTRDHRRNIYQFPTTLLNNGDFSLTPPVATQLLGTPDGKAIGESILSARAGTCPELLFHLEDVLLGVNSVVLY